MVHQAAANANKAAGTVSVFLREVGGDPRRAASECRRDARAPSALQSRPMWVSCRLEFRAVSLIGILSRAATDR